jgi:hypothetical protein
MLGFSEFLEDEVPYGVLFRAPLGRKTLRSTRRNRKIFQFKEKEKILFFREVFNSMT